MSTRFAPKAVLLVGLAVAGCDVNIHEGKASVGVFSAEANEDWTHRYPLADGGVVEIVNINGPVDVTAGAAGTVDVHAAITAKALTEAGARDILSQGKVQEVAEAARVRVETMAPRGIHGSYVVGYEVRVPPGARTVVSATNGSVTADGVAGTVKATAVNGKMQLQNIAGSIDSVVANGSLTARLGSVTLPIRLEVTNGSLTLEMPSTTRATLSARVVNGGLTVSGFRVDQPAGGRRMRSLEAVLNGGGPEIELRTTNGRISIEGK